MGNLPSMCDSEGGEGGEGGVESPAALASWEWQVRNRPGRIALCTTARLLYTSIAGQFGGFFSETRLRPHPRRGTGSGPGMTKWHSDCSRRPRPHSKR